MFTSAKRLPWPFHQRLAGLAHRARLEYTPIPPFEVFLETSAFCNLKCPTCPQAGGLGGRVKGNMSFELFQKVIDEAKGWASQVSLFLSGEPLLYDKMKEGLEYAHAAGLYTRLHSNLLLLSKKNIDTLLSPALDELSVSFDGPTETHYDQIRVGGDFAQCLEKTRWLLEEKRRRGLTKPRIIIQSIQLAGESPEELFRGDELLLEGLAYDEIKVIPSHSYGGYYEGAVRRQAETDDRYDACGMLYNRMAVLWDGRVAACCNDLEGAYIAGDINEASLLDIWNGPRLRALRVLLRDRRHHEVGLCGACDVPWSSVKPKRTPLSASIMRQVARLFEAMSK